MKKATVFFQTMGRANAMTLFGVLLGFSMALLGQFLSNNKSAKYSLFGAGFLMSFAPYLIPGKPLRLTCGATDPDKIADYAGIICAGGFWSAVALFGTALYMYNKKEPNSALAIDLFFWSAMVLFATFSPAIKNTRAAEKIDASLADDEEAMLAAKETPLKLELN